MEAAARMSTRWVLAALVLLGATPALTTACTCLEWPSFERALRESDSVFKGTVVTIRPVGPHDYGDVRVTLQVDAWWKGAPPETVDVLTAKSEAACGFTFLVGSEYVVFALRNQSGALWTHLCWRTHPVWPDDADLAALVPPHSLPVKAQAWAQIKALYRR